MYVELLFHGTKIAWRLGFDKQKAGTRTTFSLKILQNWRMGVITSFQYESEQIMNRCTVELRQAFLKEGGGGGQSGSDTERYSWGSVQALLKINLLPPGSNIWPLFSN